MGDVAYQNKDIASKVTAESLVGKSLAPFGLPDLKVVEILPTNLPEIEANELRLNTKIHAGERLTEEEMAQLMILPLTVKGKTGKQYYIEKAIWLARQMSDGEQSVRAIAGILTFSDKVIDREYARKVKEELRMTKVEQLIFEEGMEAGIEKGIEKGIERGIQVFIRNCKEFHVKREDTKQRMREEFSLSEETAKSYLEKYWD